MYHKSLLPTLLALFFTVQVAAQELYVGSYNIRYQNGDDAANGNAWQQRCPVLCDQVNFEHPDVFGAQEVLEAQLNDMHARLDGYDYIGVGRDDGKTKGEYAAIFYDKQKLHLVDSGHFWLSETPDKPSLGWDAACIRICTWGLFEANPDINLTPNESIPLSPLPQQFYFFNLHMDHVGVVARREAAKLVMERITQMAGDATPVVLTGDFNVDQHDEIYTLFTQSGLLRDCYTDARLRFAENGTFNGWHQERKTDSRIDHIFVTKQFTIDRYGILTNAYWTDQRRLPSDHYPVFVRLKPHHQPLPAGRGGITSKADNTGVHGDAPPTSQTILSLSGQYLQAGGGSVNPFIGTGGHGHVFLGANVPFGFVQLGPTQHNQGWDWCSGYHYSDSIIVGFGHLHLSGTGIGDLGDVALLPVLDPKQQEVKFSHRAEYARPGYYAVTLDNGIRVELTATERTGLHRYTLPADAQQGYIKLDLNQGIGWDKVTKCNAFQESPTTICGYRRSNGWANDQIVFFVAEFSRPVEIFEHLPGMMDCSEAERLANNPEYGKFNGQWNLRFSGGGQPLLVRVGLSAVSLEGAKANLKAEQSDWDFQRTVADAGRKWDEQLQKIRVSGGTTDERTIFYTALYHTMTAPSVFCDVDGSYRGADGKVHQGLTPHTNYTTFSLWDTYRAAHPLMTLIHPEMQEDIATTMLNIWREQGKLPVWHLMGNETNCMVGNPAIPVLADLVLKGLTKQQDDAFEAMKASAMLDERGLKLLKEYGYIPCDLFDDHETVGRGLEYALADWCVARVAEKLGRKADQKYFDQRAQSYRRYFDKHTGFMRGLDSHGQFSFTDPATPFSPFHSAPKNRDYTEGNAWQYTWLVPHDVRGLVSLFGSEQRFVSKLDSLFIVDSDLGEEAPPDISGLIGQYAHGNEPSHHVLYLYNYVGQPWKGAKLIRRTMNELYRNAPDGLSGNEDVGQMSAWYILSAMGLYQVEPAGGKYVFGSPLFPEVTMQVGHGKTFTIRANDVSADDIYIQSARLNGRPYTRSYIMYDDIVSGGVLEWQMGPQPSDFGTKKKERP
ncbi:MAG: GH92 family glycosyl hydrolase [Prevotella sp.]|nr:GH92 family glycosyl hydrolase [Prevotella sp.]